MPGRESLKENPGDCENLPRHLRPTSVSSWSCEGMFSETILKHFYIMSPYPSVREIADSNNCQLGFYIADSLNSFAYLVVCALETGVGS